MDNATVTWILCKNSSHYEASGSTVAQWAPGEKVIYTIVISILIVFTTFGNLLTIVAVARVRYLRSVSYLFIASLAGADLLVGCFVMPISMMYTITFEGVWTFGPYLCDLWQFMDYVGCTASLTNLCTIALDRYMTVSKPLKAIHKRTKKRAAQMISITWLIPVIHWATFIGIIRYLHGRSPVGTCSLRWEPHYLVIIAAMIIIYIPIASILVLFAMIYFSLRAHSKHLSARLNRCSPAASSTDVCNDVICMEDSRYRRLTNKQTIDTYVSIVTNEENATCCDLLYFGSKEYKSKSSVVGNRFDQELSSDLQIIIICDVRSSSVTYTNTSTNTSRDWLNSFGDPRCVTSCYQLGNAPRPHVIFRARSYSEPTLSTNEIKLRKPIEENANQKIVSQRAIKSESYPLKPARHHRSKFSEDYRRNRQRNLESSRLAQQIKIAKTLAIIMIFIMLSWLPFAIMWPIKSICPTCLSEKSYNISFWINYLNSALNPILYCLCNPNFRRAFLGMLKR